jgi:hypothetical protein
VFVICTGLVAGFFYLEAEESPLASARRTEKEFIKRPKPYLRDLDRVEALSQAFAALLKPVLLEPKPSGFDAALHPEFRAEWGRSEDFHEFKEAGGRLRRLPKPAASREQRQIGTEDFVRRIQKRFAGLVSIERSKLQIFSTLVASDEASAAIEAHVQLAGLESADNHLFEWRATIAAEFQKTSDGQWQIFKLQEQKATITIMPPSPFHDVSRQVGLLMVDSAENRKNAQAIINARKTPSNGGLSITDFNQDGSPDILVSRKGRGTTLFLNDQKGGFQAAQIQAFAKPSEAAKFYLWVDLDGDGQDDLVSTRFVLDAQQNFSMTLYRRDEDQLIKDENSLRFADQAWLRDLDFQGIVACDVDKNGFLDLIFVGYTHLESGLRQTNFVQGTDGARNLLFMNHGNFKFTEEGQKRGLHETFYSFVAECHDFDQDGDVDLFVGNDYGQNNLYQNDGKGVFKDDRAHPFHRGRGFSMGISMADFDNRGHYAVSLSNMYSHAGNRIVPLADNLSTEMKEVLLGYAAGNSLFERKNGKWQETAVDRQVEFAQWAWGNVFFDFDNDRDQDLYVVNGFTSHEDPKAPDF